MVLVYLLSESLDISVYCVVSLDIGVLFVSLNICLLRCVSVFCVVSLDLSVCCLMSLDISDCCVVSLDISVCCAVSLDTNLSAMGKL